MRLVHARADRLVVALLQSLADVEHPFLLADDITGPFVVLLRDPVPDGIELLHRSSAQELLPEHLRHTLARGAAVVVGRTHQLVLHARIDEHQPVALRIEREVGVLQRAAVQPDQVALLAEHRGELVHDAAVHAAVVVLGGLADLRQLELVDAAAAEVVQREGVGRFQRRRRGHARSQRHVARENRVETADRPAALADLAADAENIPRPALGRLVRLLEAELRRFAQIERIGAHTIRTVEPDGRHDALVHGSGEDETSVVVGMFADQIDTPRRGEQHGARTVKLFEFLAGFLFHLFHSRFVGYGSQPIIRR